MILFFIGFVSIFLLGFQQQNVTGGHYKLAFFNSMLIALSQFTLYREAVASEYIDVLYLALGGAIGITLSMYIHRRWRKKNERHVSNK